MKLPRWIAAGLGLTTGPRQAANPDRRFQVTNRTRQTVLASNIEVAGNSATRGRGLLGRKGLPAGSGLWIVPCESVHTFGMQFAIDLIYLDRKRRIRKLRSNVRPWRISACLSAHSILELPAGTIRSTRTTPNDVLEFSETAAPASS